VIKILAYVLVFGGMVTFIWVATPANAPKLGISALAVAAVILISTYLAWILRDRRRSDADRDGDS
jgi:Flp pilus assembly protein TadB